MGLDWGADSVAAVRDRVGPGLTPAVWVQFAQVPLRPEDRASLDGFIAQVRSVGGLALITLEPTAGLATVDAASAATWPTCWPVTGPAASGSSSGSPTR